VCWFYESQREYAGTARQFLLDGLERGERLLCVGDVAVRSATEGVDALPDAAELVRTGRLQLHRLPDAYGPDGAPRPLAEQLRFYSAAVERALAEGYSGLRTAAEVTSLVERPGRWAEHLRWERLADRFIADGPGMATLCAYRADAVDERRRGELAAVHPLGGGCRVEAGFRLFFERGALVLSGDVDSFCAAQLATLLGEAPVSGSRATLDVSLLAFIDCAGAGVLAEWGRALAADGIELELRGASRMLRRLWSLLDYDDAATLPADA
jgi:ABC-type transporter Mla MlaB component